ncbi:SIMPL domain-containing protein [Sphingomonas phyllosphaerae]|uniref:SIMPL domain-containing protein n=1 Tax=Sphingomonas phyllosphaerae TaxID=257003 RepID=UPI00042A1FE3|nr:SIMPL domain-containing protein [Sphingomonas phyllosphaerae]
MLRNILLAAALVATPALATAAEDPSRIRVTGHGKVSTDPDVASLSFAIRGEGTSTDDAARALSRKRTAIAEGLAGLLGPKAVLRTGDLSMVEVRDRACFGTDGDDDRPKLSSGACAVRGYIAVMEGSLRISPVKDAGTALSLASRLGAVNARLSGFSLGSPSAARQRAQAAAIADARARATAIAAASGARLGRLLSVEDPEARSGGQDIAVTATRGANAYAPAPVAIDITPEPVDTSATLIVTYAIES